MNSTARITLSEIARRAGTSPMAVSVVLNGARSNTRVSDATRARIREVASGLNYTPNALAQGLKRQRSNTLGVLFSWAGESTLSDTYSMVVLGGVARGAATAGQQVLLYTNGWVNADESSSAFSDRRTDGVILVAPRPDSDVVPGLLALRIPVVVVSSTTDLPGVGYVDIDNRLGVSLALDHLWELGHRRIAYVSNGRNDQSDMQDRCDAYHAWMARHGLLVPDIYAPENIVENIAWNDAGGRVKRLQKLLTAPDAPTAVCAGNDDMAALLLEAAHGVGINVPQQLSVVGFDDAMQNSTTQPKLTTIRQPLADMGKMAVRLLIDAIERKGVPADSPTGRVVPPQLIVRDSTGPVLDREHVLFPSASA